MKTLLLTMFALTAGCGGGAHFGDGVDCGGHSCEKGTVCCLDVSQSAPVYTCDATCPTNTLTVSCDGPEDCDPNGAKYCCDQYALMSAPSTAPNCAEAGVIACAHSCVFVQPPGSACVGNGSVRLCDTSADCAGDATHPNCCGSLPATCVDDPSKQSYLANGGTCS